VYIDTREEGSCCGGDVKRRGEIEMVFQVMMNVLTIIYTQVGYWSLVGLHDSFGQGGGGEAS
jgi:hypothetical protein